MPTGTRDGGSAKERAAAMAGLQGCQRIPAFILSTETAAWQDHAMPVQELLGSGGWLALPCSIHMESMRSLSRQALSTVHRSVSCRDAPARLGIKIQRTPGEQAKVLLCSPAAAGSES